MLAKNALCWCGKGKKFKRCHYPMEQPKTVVVKDEKISRFKRPPTLEQMLKEVGVSEKNMPGESKDAQLQQIFDQKRNNTRPKPSAKIIDNSGLLTAIKRNAIIDIAAKGVDENWAGRGEMCQQFAMVVKALLKEEGIGSKIFEGQAFYFDGALKFQWNHFWLITENDELIDCNIDSLTENPFAPKGLSPSNYWGPVNNIPPGRVYKAIKEFSDQDEIDLEKADDETVVWKKEAYAEYEQFKL